MCVCPLKVECVCVRVCVCPLKVECVCVSFEGGVCVCVFYREGDCMTILHREDQEETQWWLARCGDKEGYIPRNLRGSVCLSVCLCVCVIAEEQCFPNWGTRTPRGTQR